MPKYKFKELEIRIGQLVFKPAPLTMQMIYEWTQPGSYRPDPKRPLLQAEGTFEPIPPEPEK